MQHAVLAIRYSSHIFVIAYDSFVIIITLHFNGIVLLFRPKFRYPYYTDRGDGALVYGYGGKDLHNYTDFETLSGYFKRR